MAKLAMDDGTGEASPTGDARTRGVAFVSGRKKGPLEGRLAVSLVEAAYVIVLGFLFARLIWTAVTPLSTPDAVPVQAPRTAAQDVSIFDRFDPFFGAPRATPVAPVALIVEETRLNLALVGTVVTGDMPSATIQTDGGRQAVFGIGDEIIAGVTLREVYPNHVLISRNGVNEALSLEGRERIVPDESAGTASQPANLTSSGVPSAGLPGVAQFIQLTPATEGGFVLAPGDDPTIFEISGLIAGDVLVAANGRPLPADLAQAQGALLRLLARGPMTVTINRSGATFDLEIDPTGLP